MLKELSTLPLFNHIPHEIVMDFAERAREEKYKKGKMLLFQGDQADSLYLIQKGWVKLFRQTASGDEAVIDVITTQQLFGEVAIFDGGHYSWNAQVVDDVQLLIWPAHFLKDQASKHPQIMQNLLQILANHHEKRDQEIEHIKVQNAPQRLGCFLLNIATKLPLEPQEKYSVSLPYDKSLLALKLGMKSETFSRALTTLKKESDILVKGSTVTIPSMTKLSHYCCVTCSNEFPCKE